MAGLPKKYAKMGFKKGWAAYRRKKKGGKHSGKRSTKKVRPMARRRRYYGRKRRSGRKNITIPIGGIGIAAATIVQLNGDVALGQLMEGDARGALSTLGSNSVVDVVAAGIPVMVYGAAKKMMGTQTLFQIGRVRITL